MELNLSSNQVREFRDNGYIICPNLLTSKEVKTVSQICNQLKEEARSLNKHGKIDHKGSQFVLSQNNDKTSIDRIVWAGGSDKRLLEMGRMPIITHKVAQLLESDHADHLTNQMHFKSPNDNVKFLWHIDLHPRQLFDPNWQDINKLGSFVQVVIAIDTHTKENGPIKIIPYTHKNGPLDFPAFCTDNELPDHIDPKTAIPLLLDAGDAAFIHPYLVHGSEPNMSKYERKTLINGFSYPGANNGLYPGHGSAQQISLK
jgi:ectoine hydroxylase